MNRALLELRGAAQLRRGLLPLSGHFSELQSVNGSYAQSCCHRKLAQLYMHASCWAPQLSRVSYSSSSRHLHARSQTAQKCQAAQAHTTSPTRLQVVSQGSHSQPTHSRCSLAPNMPLCCRLFMQQLLPTCLSLSSIQLKGIFHALWNGFCSVVSSSSSGKAGSGVC